MGERALKVSVELPTMAVDTGPELVSGDAVSEIAAAIETAGFDGCHVTDHPAGDARWLAGGGHHALDPFVALSFAAAATRSLRVITYVYIPAYRNPFISAKAALSLDVLSNGRFVFGMAAGYLKPEFGALGVDFDERNELLDEAIEVMKLAWTQDEVAYDGRHFRARAVSMRPRPIARPHPPLWMGGNSYRAIRRAVEHCQGWVPFASGGMSAATRTAEIASVDDLRARIEYARAHASAIGRTEPLDISFSAMPAAGDELDAAREREQLDQLRDAGVTWVSVGFTARDRMTYIDRLRRYADDVLG
jgi:probable F420-dependent oxidoreductase